MKLSIPSPGNCNIIRKIRPVIDGDFGLMVLCSVPGLARGWRIGAVIRSRVWMSGKWVLGRQTVDERQDESNLLKSKLIVLWGFNPGTTLSNHAIYTMIRARERGIPIISIEPRYTPTAEAVASQWIPIRPTTDVAMMIAMANVWFREALCDKEFINKWVEPDGLRRWKDYVLGVSDGTEKNPQWAEKICGVPAETITEFARLYARSSGQSEYLVFPGPSILGGERHPGCNLPPGADRNTMSPGATASAETACEFGAA